MRGFPAFALEFFRAAGYSVGLRLGSWVALGVVVSLVVGVDAGFEVLLRGCALGAFLGVVVVLVGAFRGRVRVWVWGLGVAVPGPVGVAVVLFVGPGGLDGWGDLCVLVGFLVAAVVVLFLGVALVAGVLWGALLGVAWPLGLFLSFCVGVCLVCSVFVVVSVWLFAVGLAW
ncbi:hypothetical protein SAMN04487939_103253 [Lysobacter sp. yr284]|nr:hypothetical protein SAMN04487939_103253 [Lysobacter sp. yr284]